MRRRFIWIDHRSHRNKFGGGRHSRVACLVDVMNDIVHVVLFRIVTIRWIVQVEICVRPKLLASNVGPIRTLQHAPSRTQIAPLLPFMQGQAERKTRPQLTGRTGPNPILHSSEQSHSLIRNRRHYPRQYPYTFESATPPTHETFKKRVRATHSEVYMNSGSHPLHKQEP
jgi:hypothetical protein